VKNVNSLIDPWSEVLLVLLGLCATLLRGSSDWPVQGVGVIIPLIASWGCHSSQLANSTILSLLEVVQDTSRPFNSIREGTGGNLAAYRSVLVSCSHRPDPVMRLPVAVLVPSPTLCCDCRGRT